MDEGFEAALLKGIEAKSISFKQTLQDLWSGYGKLSRFDTQGSEFNTIIIKEIDLKSKGDHPRGWNTGTSHQRKLKSYQIEAEWYNHWAWQCKEACRVPKLLYQYSNESEIIIVLEDLDASGFPSRLKKAGLDEIKVTLQWLANFHANFINHDAKGLWPEGCYWHLNTRQDELDQMQEGKLKQAAGTISERLDNAKYQTIIHEDAKLDNFCYSEDHQQNAAVDFQYVGGGCGIKDVAYFLSSCMDSEELFTNDQSLLEYYFKELESALASSDSHDNFDHLIQEWSDLYPYAWADFTRFLQGWSPEHWKLHDYSNSMVNVVLNDLG